MAQIPQGQEVLDELSPLHRELREATSVLAVCAHPDDESFGLGGIIGALTEFGSRVTVLCFTHGEASTLGGSLPNLRELRAEELHRAGGMLGLEEALLLDYPDGHLAEVPLRQLSGEIDQVVARAGVDTLLVFDPGGITGHPDHRRATEAALSAAETGDLDVLGWVLPAEVAATLNREFQARFIGRNELAADVILEVDRGRQWRAIAAHRSQSRDNPVLDRRLQLMGNKEWLCWLRRPQR